MRKLTRRGLCGIRLLISDTHEGIKAAVSKVVAHREGTKGLTLRREFNTMILMAVNVWIFSVAKQQISTFSLPGPRGKQLQALAKARGQSVADIMTDVIHASIVAGELPDVTPGHEVTRNEDGSVSLLIDHYQLSMEPAGAMSLAETIENVLQCPGKRIIDVAVRPIPVEVARAGAGIAIEVSGRQSRDLHAIVLGREPSPPPRARSVMALSIAADIARQLRKAAGTVSNHTPERPAVGLQGKERK